jgi:hypothetical protein
MFRCHSRREYEMESSNPAVGRHDHDPGRICWVLTLPPEEDEPDIFANLAEDSSVWESKGDTIRAIVSRVSDVSAQAPHQMPGRVLPDLRESLAYVL